MKVIDIRTEGQRVRLSLELTFLLKELNTKLVTVLLDVSGSGNPSLTAGVLREITDAISITANGGRVNLIQFDTLPHACMTCPTEQLAAKVASYQINMGGGGQLQPTFNLLAGKPDKQSASQLAKITPRVGPLADTPIIIVSDACIMDVDMWAVAEGKLHPSKADPVFKNVILLRTNE